MKRTYQPSNIKRKRSHGFRIRMRTKAGRLILKARRAKGRKKLSAWDEVNPRTRRFPLVSRLIKPADFRKVFATKTRSVDTLFVVLANPSELQYARLGLAVSKKRLALAVKRNRVKRLIRESFRHHQDKLKVFDIVVIAQKKTAAIDNSKLNRSLANHWQRIGQCVK